MASDRFVNNTLSELQEANRSPIFGYEDSPVLVLEEAVEKIIPPISHAMDYVATAKKKCNRQSTLLTVDESAAIYLYSMPISFFTHLNEALRAENRHALKPWFAFLKLFITGLEKLPSTKKTVWRGISGDLRSISANDDIHIWWSVNSCSMALNVVERYLGEIGTVFAIDTTHGKDISAFSNFPDEQEIVLMPGTRVRAKCQSLNFGSRFFLVHLEEENPQSESQSESSYLFEFVKQKYRRHSRIERIMNPAKSFPIEQSYINLAIVKIKEQQEKEKQLRDSQHSHAIIDSFEEIYGMKTAIDIKNIFQTCKNEEKQVLVFGRAGIGKSTFCRYVAYQWATGSFSSQYELLAFIPLYRLTTNRYPLLPLGQNYSLIDLVKKEVFQDDLTEKDKPLLTKHFDAKTTLWILDGYDEIIQNLPPHLQCLFEQLLKTPHHILTSRPYMNTLSYDVQMEITGFTDENIEEYIQQFFVQMEDELDDVSVKSQKLLSFLSSNTSIWGVAHIPLNLELICSVSSNANWSERKELTITTLYKTMTEWLCRRYLTAQNIPIQKITEKELYHHCHKELALLESLAFNAMESNTIILRRPLLEKALDEANISFANHPHVLNVGILKSFREQGTGTQIETDKDHYFVHLSFQEYFAARYLINALNGSSTDKAIAFIKHQKYNQRYALLFSFASGLVSEGDAKPCLDIFWDTILGEPLDLVGIRHMQLVISCLEETFGKSTLPQYTVLIGWIAECIKYSFSGEKKIIRQYLSQSLQRAQSVACNPIIINVLIDKLHCNDTTTTGTVLSFVSELQISNPSIALINSVTSRLDHKSEHVRRNACLALQQIGKKAATNEVISQLVSAVGNESANVRRYACQALGNMGGKAATNEVISKLVSALGDDRKDVRLYACEALGKIGEKAATNELINQLVSAVGNESTNVRRYACEALGNIGEKAATNEVISKLVSTLGDENEYVRENACEALGNIGGKAATNEVISKLVNTLGDESKGVRWTACRTLGKIGEKIGTNEMISTLVSALGDERDYVRRYACQTLGKIGGKAATNEVISKLVSTLGDENEYVRENACEALGNIGAKAATNEVISKLVSTLGDENEYVRENACEALGNIGEKIGTNEMISTLVSALGDERDYVRRYACQTLGKIGGKAATDEVISKLVSTLEDRSKEVRWHTCETIKKIGENAATNEVINKLVSALEDESPSVRMRACEALGSLGGNAATSEVINKLVSVLEDESPSVKRYTCEALGNIGEKAATNDVINKLVSALGDESSSVRRYACEALGKLGEKAATNEVINKLMSVLGDENENVRMYACLALGYIGEKATTNEAISKLVSALGDESSSVRCYACEALGKLGEKAATNEVINKLMSVLGDENENVRMYACLALGYIGEKATTNEAISKLVSALGDESVNVRMYACEALEKIGGKAATNEVISKLASALGDESAIIRQYACATVRKLGEKAATNEVISKLVSALGDPSNDVRTRACEVLGNIGEKAATNEVISKLVSVLGDESEDVRMVACQALENIGDKAATNEAISKLLVLINNDSDFVSTQAARAVGNILSSFAVIPQLAPKIISNLCLYKHGSDCLKNVSENQLMKFLFTVHNPDLLFAVTHITLLRGVAVTVIGDKIVIYGRKEPLELPGPSLQLRQQLIEAFSDQAKRLHLYFEMSSKPKTNLEGLLAFCDIL